MTLRIAAAVAVLALAAQAQTTWYVDVNGTPPGTGTQADPYTSIQYAISQGSTLPGDTVLVLPGTYQETIDFLGKAIEVRSQMGAQQTTLDGGSSSSTPVVSFTSGESRASLLQGFALINSTSGTPTSGRAVLIASASPSISECTVTGFSTAAMGGAVYLFASTAEFTDCTFQGNEEYSGVFNGGACFIEGGAPRFVDCNWLDNQCGLFGHAVASDSSDPEFVRNDFVSNNAGNPCFGISGAPGSAVLINGGGAEFDACTFIDNHSSFGGGALDVQAAIVEAADSVFEGNCTAGDGGAILVRAGGVLTLNRCTIRDSFAYFNGGGLAIGGTLFANDISVEDNRAGPDAHNGGGIHVSGSAFIDSSKITGNLATRRGGGIHVEGFGPVELADCVIANNESFTDTGIFPSSGAGISAGFGTRVERSVVADNHVTGNPLCFVVGPAQEGVLNEAAGGGVRGPVMIQHSVIWGNSTYGSGGAGALDSTILNSVVWANYLTGCDGFTTQDALGGSASASYSIVEGGWPGAGILDARPRFWGAPIGDFNLLPDSPCIDAGDPSSPGDPDGSRADIGVFPFDPTYCGDPFTYCDGKTNSLGCVPFLTTNGFPSATSTEPFEIIANDVLPGEAGFLIYGFNKNMLGYHGGTLCVKAPLARLLPPKFAKSPGTPPCTGRLVIGFNKRIQSGQDVLLFPGQTIYAQIRQRDPQDPAGFGDGLTDAVQFTICP